MKSLFLNFFYQKNKKMIGCVNKVYFLRIFFSFLFPSNFGGFKYKHLYYIEKNCLHSYNK